jgi:hypothetical protein
MTSAICAAMTSPREDAGGHGHPAGAHRNPPQPQGCLIRAVTFVTGGAGHARATGHPCACRACHGVCARRFSSLLALEAALEAVEAVAEEGKAVQREGKAVPLGRSHS